VIRGIAHAAACMMIAASLPAAPQVTTIEPTFATGAMATEFVATGLELDGVTAVSLLRGQLEIPATVTHAGAEELRFHAPLLGKVGMWDLRLEATRSAAVVVPLAIEVTQPGQARLARASSPAPFPLAGFHAQYNMEALFLPSELGASPLGICRLEVPASMGLGTGNVTVRMKEVLDTSFASDQLDASGWTVCYSGAMPTPLPGGSVEFELTKIFAYTGSASLVISIVTQRAVAEAAATARAWDAGSTRFRAGWTLISAGNATAWSGTTPSNRSLTSQVPELVAKTCEPAIAAAFAPPMAPPEAGQPVNFTAQLPAHPVTIAWDFNRDGNVDATTASASHTFPVPGTWPVELVLRNGFVADSQTHLVTVVGDVPEVVTWELF
jgi:hypothetical protein